MSVARPSTSDFTRTSEAALRSARSRTVTSRSPRRTYWTSVESSSAASAPQAAAAGDPVAGKEKAAQCASCHGPSDAHVKAKKKSEVGPKISFGENDTASVAEQNLNRVVLAACSCCAVDQVCYSCTYQRVRCKDNLLGRHFDPGNPLFEFVNIREQCAWIHEGDPQGATATASVW